MKILVFSPGYPAELPRFTRALAEVGAQVYGVGEQPPRALSAEVRHALTDYLRVGRLLDEERALREIVPWARQRRIQGVESLWEPTMLLAGRLRDALEIPGLSHRRTLPFRDKELMKQVLDEAGIRTPRHGRARSADEVRRCAERVGYPLIVKPIAGGGSADTYRVDNGTELERIIPRLDNVAEVSVEEFIDGEELTYDTICAGGQILFENMSWYRPRPLDEKKYEWISPQTYSLRAIDEPYLVPGKEMGRKVLQAMGYRTGFSHMEWFHKADGDIVFGEIGARPPGARMVELMNFACDVDCYRGWAEAVVHGRWSQSKQRPYNSVMVAKRAHGQGRIKEIRGVAELKAHVGEALVADELLPVGSPRRDWQATSVADGYLVLRHPDFAKTREFADLAARHVTLYAD